MNHCGYLKVVREEGGQPISELLLLLLLFLFIILSEINASDPTDNWSVLEARQRCIPFL